MVDDNLVNQSGASAEGDIAGRDLQKTVYNFRPTKIDELVRRLEREQEVQSSTPDIIESLQYYLTPIAPDGVIGLEAKLDRAGRADQKLVALKQKELFAKLLERWSHFGSAQGIFAELLARIEQRYNNTLYPKVLDVSREDFDEMVYREIIVPLSQEVCAGPLSINETVLSGMVYWLAEQCYVKWHK